MSVWTQVVGCIRIDGIPKVDREKYSVNAIKEILGPIYKYDDDDDILEACKLPVGSEGSLQYAITEYHDGMPWVAVSIWGSLRDYSDSVEIVRWVEGLIETLTAQGYWIRDGVLRIEVEGSGVIAVLSLNNDGLSLIGLGSTKMEAGV